MTVENTMGQYLLGIKKMLQEKGWAVKSTSDKPASYRLLHRTRDLDDGIVHLKDPISGNLAICGAGFASMRLDMNVSNAAVPTCAFCVVGMQAGLPYWRLGEENHRRRILRELCGEG